MKKRIANSGGTAQDKTELIWETEELFRKRFLLPRSSALEQAVKRNCRKKAFLLGALDAIYSYRRKHLIGLKVPSGSAFSLLFWPPGSKGDLFETRGLASWFSENC